MSIYIFKFKILILKLAEGSKDIGEYLPAHFEIEGPIVQLKVLEDSEEAGLSGQCLSLSKKGMPRCGRLWLVFALGFCGC